MGRCLFLSYLLQKKSRMQGLTAASCHCNKKEMANPHGIKGKQVCQFGSSVTILLRSGYFGASVWQQNQKVKLNFILFIKN